MKQLTFTVMAFALFGLTDLRAAVLYSVTDLGAGYQPNAINNQGVITGLYSPGMLPGSHAFIYSNGQSTLLGTLGGDYSGGNAINNLGQVTGDSSIVNGFGLPTHAFLYSNGQLTDLGLGGSVGLGINDKGQIVGELSQTQDRAFLYTGTQTISIGTLGGLASYANGINNLSEVIGNANLPNGTTHGFLYTAGQMTDLGTLGGSTSSASAINDHGQIVGSATTASGAIHAFLYNNGLMSDLGTLGTMYTGSGANGINNLGQVVGSSLYYVAGSEVSSYPVYTATLYSNGITQDLNSLIDPSLGITLTTAVGINDGGQIIADGRTRTAPFESFLLTPVPEPSVVALLAAGLLVFATAVGVRRSTHSLSGKPDVHGN